MSSLDTDYSPRVLWRLQRGEHVMGAVMRRTTSFALGARKEGTVRALLLKGLAVLALLTANPLPSTADPITFVHTGSGRGTLAGAEFGTMAPLPFTIAATGDTDDRRGFDGGVFIDHLTASISIDGLGDFDLVTETRTFVNNSVGLVAFSRWGVRCGPLRRPAECTALGYADGDWTSQR